MIVSDVARPPVATDDGPPLALIVFQGMLVTPTVALGFNVLQSIWLTYLSLYWVWVISPAVVCFCWPSARVRIKHALHLGLQRLRMQTVLAVSVSPLLIGSVLLSYHVVAKPLHIDERSMRPLLVPWGLSSASVGFDIGTLMWLTFLNPVMEEFFWRVYLLEMLRPFGNDGPTCARGWAPTAISATLYASYHVVVVSNFLPMALCLLSFVCLAMLGLALQGVLARVGLIAAIGVHLAVDACLSLIIADVLWRWGLADR